jgi:hypothetical protein
MPRYRLRTLLIALALEPPLLAVGWSKYAARCAERNRLRMIVTMEQERREVVEKHVVAMQFLAANPPPWNKEDVARYETLRDRNHELNMRLMELRGYSFNDPARYPPGYSPAPR